MPRGTRTIIVDDVLATGGTAKAAASLVIGQGGEVIAYAFVIELEWRWVRRWRASGHGVQIRARARERRSTRLGIAKYRQSDRRVTAG